MADETFEMASDLKRQRSYLYDLRDLLLNSGGCDKTKHLAAINTSCNDFVINDLYLQKEIQSRFLEIIQEEIDRLDRQFAEL